ncbi:MAG: polysaccharide biosynthesis protein [Planctomycetes bacterium]|nr:polysaccharide biosynthesis protein [Planctomycetota bacterium]
MHLTYKSVAYRLLWIVLDIVCMLAAMGAALVLLKRTPGEQGVQFLCIIVAVRLGFFVRMGMYRAVLRYSGIHTLFVAAASIVAGSLAGVVIAFFFLQAHLDGLGRAFVVLEALLSLVACGGMRILVRISTEWGSARSGRRAVIYGAGSLGELVLRGLRRTGELNPIGFIDDDPRRVGRMIHGRRVLGTLADLPQICRRYEPEMLITAIHQLPPQKMRGVIQACMDNGIKAKKGVGDVMSASGQAKLADFKLEDLLRRPPRNLDRLALNKLITGKTVLVTGAGGSIGSELCMQIAALGAQRLILLDHSEINLYTIDQRLGERFPDVGREPVLLDLQSRRRVEQLLTRVRPDVVFHAAAYKHVPLVESNPFIATRNNVNGFRNVLDAAVAAGIGLVVLISTDKAVHPTNVMGCTKRVCELLLQSHPSCATRMCAVRFGNVLGSSGSVIPRFLEQIAQGGPVTVTHPEVTRYFMLIPEAVELVLHAGAMATHGEIFILDMGEPVRIADMARQLIFLTGNIPDRDIEISYTGLRPGEKLYEELLKNDSEQSAAVDGITIARTAAIDYTGLRGAVQALLEACEHQDRDEFLGALRALVPEWVPSSLWYDAQFGESSPLGTMGAPVAARS